MAESITSPDDPSEHYRPPAQKSVEEIMATDAEDESLQRYKQQLLGGTDASRVVVGQHST